MTTTEKLNAIRINCRSLLSRPYPDTAEARLARAGWQATLAAIELCAKLRTLGSLAGVWAANAETEIIAAWEGLL